VVSNYSMGKKTPYFRWGGEGPDPWRVRKAGSQRRKGGARIVEK